MKQEQYRELDILLDCVAEAKASLDEGEVDTAIWLLDIFLKKEVDESLRAIVENARQKLINGDLNEAGKLLESAIDILMRKLSEAR